MAAALVAGTPCKHPSDECRDHDFIEVPLLRQPAIPAPALHPLRDGRHLAYLPNILISTDATWDDYGRLCYATATAA